VRLLTVILNWRTAPMTIRAAEAVLPQLRPGDALTIVDNDSGDGSFEAISAAMGDRARVIQAGRNGGFGAGNNVGIRAGMPNGSRPDLVFIQNSDAFPDPGAVDALRNHLLAHHEAGFAGSYIHGPDGEPHLTTFRFPSVASEFEGQARFGPITRALAGSVVPVPTPERSGRVDWLAGAALMMREEVLREIGLFDETFFLYFEETDLCLRAARAGWETHFVRESSVEHIGSVSTGMKDWERVPEYWYDSRRHYFAKNHGVGGAAAAMAAHVAGGLVHRARRGLAGRRADDPKGYLRRLVTHGLGRRPARS
jgi:N-acetylglucosaminyl-diphospho-decaprenol L-rhamnosyltransferase